MSGTSLLSEVTDEVSEALHGAVDLYLHPGPELLPRDIDVVSLAHQLKDDGFAGGLLWNQFSPTAELATVVTEVTGFQLYGSIILNGTVGGVNPRVVEHSIRMGAKYVGMPTLSGSAAFLVATGPGYANAAMNLAGPVPVTDDSGALLPNVHEVLDLVKSYDVALGLGYIVYDDTMAVLKAAAERGIGRISLLRPFAGYGLNEEQVANVMTVAGTSLHFPASLLGSHESTTGGLGSIADFASGLYEAVPRVAKAIEQYGAERCVLSSDTGWNDGTALQWLQLSAAALAQFGITPDQVRRMVHESPAELIGVA